MMATSELPQVVADLLAAREVLAVRGLAKRVLLDEQRRVCANGALSCAVSGDPESCAPEFDRFRAAARAVIEVIDGDYIPPWNNAPERTQAEVEAAFLDAASLALSEAAARGEYR